MQWGAANHPPKKTPSPRGAGGRLPPSLGVLVTPRNPSWFPTARRHPRHGDVVGAREEAGNVTVCHPAWGSPHRSRMGRVAAGSQAGDSRGSRGPELPILGPSQRLGQKTQPLAWPSRQGRETCCLRRPWPWGPECPHRAEPFILLFFLRSLKCSCAWTTAACQQVSARSPCVHPHPLRPLGPPLRPSLLRPFVSISIPPASVPSIPIPSPPSVPRVPSVPTSRLAPSQPRGSPGARGGVEISAGCHQEMGERPQSSSGLFLALPAPRGVAPRHRAVAGPDPGGDEGPCAGCSVGDGAVGATSTSAPRPRTDAGCQGCQGHTKRLRWPRSPAG